MEKQDLRRPEIVIISDVHLGTYGCHARELVRYLKSIRLQVLVLNGDFIDIWQFSKRYWPNNHMKVVREITKMVSKGVQVHYITGNHDEMLRRFNGFSLGSFSISNKLVLEVGAGEKAWIFHGDVFDVTMKHSRWLARLGAVGYDLLILLNRLVNFVSQRILGRGRISLSRKIKNSVKSAVAFIDDFEQTAAAIGIDNGFHYVICGHIHQPQMRTIRTPAGSIRYLNSGDWVENLTALEFSGGNWTLYQHERAQADQDPEGEEEELSARQLFEHMVREFDGLRVV